MKSWLIGKDPVAGRDWGQEEKGTTEDEVSGWHHQLDGHEFGWTPGVGDGQGGLVCYNSWGHKELDTTERLKSITYSHSILFVISQLLLYQKVFGFSSDSPSGPWYVVFYFPTSHSVRNLESQNQGPLFARGIQSNPEATQSIETISGTQIAFWKFFTVRIC